MSVERLNRLLARTGRLIREDGTVVNEADLVHTLQTKGNSDYRGTASYYSGTGEQLVGGIADDVSISYQTHISRWDVTQKVTGTGSITHALSMAELRTGTGVGSAKIESIDSVRARSGHELFSEHEFILGAAETNVNQKVGFFNGSDGASVGFEGLVFGVRTLNDDAETFIPQGSFNLDTIDGNGASGFTLDPSKINRYRITCGFGTNSSVWSVWTGLAKGWIAFYFVDHVNADVIPNLRNGSLPVQAFVERTSGTGADVVVKLATHRAGTIAFREENNSSNRPYSFGEAEVSVNNTNEEHIFTIRNKATFNGRPNHIRVEIAVIATTVDGSKSVEFFAHKGLSSDPSIVTPDTSLTTADIETNESVIEIDTGSGNVVPVLPALASTIQSPGSRRVGVKGTGFLLNPGEEIVFSAQSASAAANEVSLSVRWLEES